MELLGQHYTDAQGQPLSNSFSFVVAKRWSDAEMKAREGNFFGLNTYDHVITHSADIYVPDLSTNTLKLLCCFRRRVLPRDLTEPVFHALLPVAKTTKTTNRGVAAGKVDLDQMSPTIIGLASPGRHKSQVIYADGTQSQYSLANSVNSFIAGYFDQPILRHKRDTVGPPCRLTNFSRDHVQEWQNVLPMIQKIDELYQYYLPDIYTHMKTVTASVPEYMINDTIFSTVTVNYNWQTAAHVDKGDYRNGYSVLTVCEQGTWEGCYFGYPQYGICFDLREGDMAIIDPHEYHCNTELHLKSDDAVRLSLVLYFREGMLKCANSSESAEINPKVVTRASSMHLAGCALKGTSGGTSAAPPPPEIDLGQNGLDTSNYRASYGVTLVQPAAAQPKDPPSQVCRSPTPPKSQSARSTLQRTASPRTASPRVNSGTTSPRVPSPQRGGNPSPQRGGNPSPQRGGNPSPQRGGNPSPRARSSSGSASVSPRGDQAKTTPASSLRLWT
jgi:hypothetical protein